MGERRKDDVKGVSEKAAATLEKTRSQIFRDEGGGFPGVMKERRTNTDLNGEKRHGRKYPPVKEIWGKRGLRKHRFNKKKVNVSMWCSRGKKGAV